MRPLIPPSLLLLILLLPGTRAQATPPDVTSPCDPDVTVVPGAGTGTPRSTSATKCVDSSNTGTHEAGCGVDLLLTFKCDKRKVKLKLIFDLPANGLVGLKEPSSGNGNMALGGTPDKPTYWFSAADFVNKVGAPADAWVIAARLWYDPNEAALAGMDTQASGAGDWEFGIIQNSEKMVYRYGYGGAQYGSPASVQGQLLDMSKLNPTPPFYFAHAHAVLGFGDNVAALKDTPSFEAPWDDPSKNRIKTASLTGKWTMWFVLRNEKANRTFYLWNVSYDISRSWDSSKSGSTMDPQGGTVAVSGGIGMGAVAPVLVKPTAGEELSKGWTKP